MAEMHDAVDATSIMNFPELRLEMEAGKEIAGKQRFCEPHGAAARCAFEADSREKNLDFQIPLQVAGANMLVLVLRANTKPGPGILNGWSPI